MSLQQTYNRAVSMPVNSYNPSPTSSVHRKQPSNHSSCQRSISPLPPQTYQSSSNHLQSPTPATPLNSFPSRPPVSPSITPPIPTSAPPQPPQKQYPSPLSTDVPHSLSQTSSRSDLKLLNTQEIDDALGACMRKQTQAVTEHGKRPFAALLLAPDNMSILASHNSISHYQHAESELARLAATQFSGKYLEKCTLVSTWEPCAMCSGTIYWAGIGRLLYAASETKLKDLTGADNSENMTMSLPCRTVFNAGQRKVEVIGPIATWEQRVVEDSQKWWKDHTAAASDLARSTSSVKENGSINSRRTSVAVYNPNDSILGSIGEDGEYQADLKIDWMP